MKNVFKNKIILVTGGTGSIGSELIHQLLAFQPKQLRIFSRDESKQYYLMEKLHHHTGVRFFVGDIRDRNRLDFAMSGVDFVFHAAALKHVPSSEYNPFEAVNTNIVGSQNVIDSALRHNVDKVIAISTDKAVNPSNVMGTTKLMMEKLIINANFYRGNARTKFSCVRFGNVAWARGSVLPLWKKQAERDKAIQVTDPTMTRFLMSINQAIHLVLEAAQLAGGGEIFVLKMPSTKIKDLAKIFIAKYYPNEKITVKNIGSRPGEKKHEELFNNAVEPKAIFESQTMIIIIPEINIFELKQPVRSYPGFKQKKVLGEFSSKKRSDPKKIRAIV